MNGNRYSAKFSRALREIHSSLVKLMHLFFFFFYGAVQLDHDQGGVLSAEDVFELAFIVEDRVRLCREEIAGHAAVRVRVAGSDVGIHLARAQIDDIQRLRLFLIKALEPLAVVVGVTEHIFLQNAHRQPDRENQAQQLDDSEKVSFHMIRCPDTKQGRLARPFSVFL